jgi:hypothetical protein
MKTAEQGTPEDAAHVALPLSLVVESVENMGISVIQKTARKGSDKEKIAAEVINNPETLLSSQSDRSG